MRSAPEVPPSPGALTTTASILERAQGGDREALERLVSDHYDRVRSAVRRAMGARLRGLEESGDIAQEALMTAVRKLDTFEPRGRGSVFAWLARIAERRVRRVARYWRAGKRDGNDVALGELQDSAGEVKFDPAASTLGPDDRVVAREEAELVRECVEELDEEQRQLVLLRAQSSLSWEAIAAITGRSSAGAARMAHARAIDRLAPALRARLEE